MKTELTIVEGVSVVLLERDRPLTLPRRAPAPCKATMESILAAMGVKPEGHAPNAGNDSRFRHILVGADI